MERLALWLCFRYLRGTLAGERLLQHDSSCMLLNASLCPLATVRATSLAAAAVAAATGGCAHALLLLDGVLPHQLLLLRRAGRAEARLWRLLRALDLTNGREERECVQAIRSLVTVDDRHRLRTTRTLDHHDGARAILGRRAGWGGDRRCGKWWRRRLGRVRRRRLLRLWR